MCRNTPRLKLLRKYLVFFSLCFAVMHKHSILGLSAELFEWHWLGDSWRSTITKAYFQPQVTSISGFPCRTLIWPSPVITQNFSLNFSVNLLTEYFFDSSCKPPIPNQIVSISPCRTFVGWFTEIPHHTSNYQWMIIFYGIE